MINQILLTWDGLQKPFDEYRAECINRIKEVYPDTRIVCITKSKESLPGNSIDEFISWDVLEDEVWKAWYVKSEDPHLMSGYIRYYYLSKNQCTLYLDTDIYLQEPINEINEIAKFKNDFSALWNGNNPGFFGYIIGLRQNNGSLGQLTKFYPYDCYDLSIHMTHKKNERKYNAR